MVCHKSRPSTGKWANSPPVTVSPTLLIQSPGYGYLIKLTSYSDWQSSAPRIFIMQYYGVAYITLSTDKRSDSSRVTVLPILCIQSPDYLMKPTNFGT